MEEAGAPSELLAKEGGAFAEMVAAQGKASVPDADPTNTSNPRSMSSLSSSGSLQELELDEIPSQLSIRDRSP